jgi:hypothetical protein
MPVTIPDVAFQTFPETYVHDGTVNGIAVAAVITGAAPVP